MRIFHGTTFNDAINILKHGFKKTNKIWEASRENKIYFFEPTKMQEIEHENVEGGIEYCLRKGFEAAQIASAIKKESKTCICVLEVEIDEEYVENDSSCDDYGYDMYELSAAVQIDIDNIKFGRIKKVYVSNNFYPSIGGLYIKDLYKRDGVKPIFKDWEEHELEWVYDLNIDCLSSLLEFEWKVFKVEDFLQKYNG